MVAAVRSNLYQLVAAATAMHKQSTAVTDSSNECFIMARALNMQVRTCKLKESHKVTPLPAQAAQAALTSRNLQASWDGFQEGRVSARIISNATVHPVSPSTATVIAFVLISHAFIIRPHGSPTLLQPILSLLAIAQAQHISASKHKSQIYPLPVLFAEVSFSHSFIQFLRVQ
jgi:hypothetical protein